MARLSTFVPLAFLVCSVLPNVHGDYYYWGDEDYDSETSTDDYGDVTTDSSMYGNRGIDYSSDYSSGIDYNSGIDYQSINPVNGGGDMAATGVKVIDDQTTATGTTAPACDWTRMKNSIRGFPSFTLNLMKQSSYRRGRQSGGRGGLMSGGGRGNSGSMSGGGRGNSGSMSSGRGNSMSSGGRGNSASMSSGGRGNSGSMSGGGGRGNSGSMSSGRGNSMSSGGRGNSGSMSSGRGNSMSSGGRGNSGSMLSGGRGNSGSMSSGRGNLGSGSFGGYGNSFTSIRGNSGMGSTWERSSGGRSSWNSGRMTGSNAAIRNGSFQVAPSCNFCGQMSLARTSKWNAMKSCN